LPAGIIMRGFHERVPVVPEEAAQVGGASRPAAMVRVAIPAAGARAVRRSLAEGLTAGAVKGGPGRVR
jgi:ABC-type maltose transport system permease subunit